jgi:hypothetical protein
MYFFKELEAFIPILCYSLPNHVKKQMYRWVYDYTCTVVSRETIMPAMVFKKGVPVERPRSPMVDAATARYSTILTEDV